MVRMKDDAHLLANAIPGPHKRVCGSAAGVLLEADLSHELPEMGKCGARWPALAFAVEEVSDDSVRPWLRLRNVREDESGPLWVVAHLVPADVPLSHRHLVTGER